MGAELAVVGQCCSLHPCRNRLPWCCKLLVAIFVTLCGYPCFRTAACCTSSTWCIAYALTFGLLLQSIPLLVSGLFAHDAHGLLSAVLTPLGVELYRDCIFGNLTMRQRGLLAQCVIITSAAEGNSSIAGFTTAKTESDPVSSLRNALNIPVGPRQSALAAGLLKGLHSAWFLRSINESSMAPFFTRYEYMAGGDYTARWNAKQTLGWRGEPGGVDTISEALHLLSHERWAFRLCTLPKGCLAPTDFDPGAAVLHTNCFFVTRDRPSDDEVRRRYGPWFGGELVPEQLDRLIADFGRARNASVALQHAVHMYGGNPAITIHGLWNRTVRGFDEALTMAHGSVVVPLVEPLAEIRDLAMDLNCGHPQESLATAAEALGKNFGGACLSLWACILALALVCAAVTALHCLLWSATLRQQRRFSGLDRIPVANVRSDDAWASAGTPQVDSFDGDSDEEEEEMEMRRPLNTWGKQWGGGR